MVSRNLFSRDTVILRIKEKIQELRNLGVERVGVFGSYARDEQTQTSDIDVGITFQADKKTFDNYMEVKFFLEEIFPEKKSTLSYWKP